MNTSKKAEILTPIVCILFIAFILRAVVPLTVILTSRNYTLFHDADTVTYVKPAKEILSHGRFFRDNGAEIFRTPGYSILLIPGIFLGNVEIVTIALQIVLSCLITYIVFRISMLLFKNSLAASFSALLYAIEPVSILYASKLMPETLCTFLTTLSAYCLVKYFKTESLKMLILASIILSVSVYVRPIGYYLPVVIAAVLLTWSFKRGKILLVTHALSFLMCSCLIIGLWQLRNYRETGYSGFSPVADINLYCYNAASVLLTHEARPDFFDIYKIQKSMGCSACYQAIDAQRRVYLQRHPEQSSWDMWQIYRFMRNEGMRIILREPATYFLIHIKGMFRTAFDPGVTEYLFMFNKYSRHHGLFGQILDQGLFGTIKYFAATMPLFFSMMTIMGIYLVVLWSFAAMGLFHRGFPHGISTIVLLFVLAYYLVVSGGPVGFHRFRHPMMPIISVFSGYGLYLVFERFRLWKTGRLSGVSFQK